MEYIDGYKVIQTAGVGFVNFYLGEREDQPGKYRVWQQNPKEENPAWEQPFSSQTEAMTFMYKKVIEKADEQRTRKNGLSDRKKLKEMEW